MLENGKAWSDAMAEATYAAEFFRLAPNGDKTIVVDHQPMGVAYMITLWNFPAAMATRKFAPALAAGCTAILKPAAEAPLTALWVVEVLRRAGVPDGVVSVVTTSEPGPVSEAVLADQRTATLSFTGSTAVGKVLLGLTAQRALPSSMELGGNAPLLVLEGADVDKAVEGAMVAAVEGAMVAKMRNGGSACTAANRFYVHDSVVVEFTDALERALAALTIGNGLDPTHDLGALVSVKERDKVLELVDRAEAEGGRAAAVSEAPAEGAFMAPRVVRGVRHGQTLTARRSSARWHRSSPWRAPTRPSRWPTTPSTG